MPRLDRVALVALFVALTGCTPENTPTPTPRPQIGAPAAVTPGPGGGATLMPLPNGSQPPDSSAVLLAKPEQAPGLFMYAKEGNIWTIRAGQSPVQLTQFKPGNFPAFPTISPDGKQVAYTYFEQPTDPKDFGGTDLYLMGLDGSNVRLLLRHETPGQSFELPFWSIDGSNVWFTSRTQKYDGNKYLGEQVQVERIEVATSKRQVEVKEASAGSRSADGKALAWIKTDTATYAQGLWIGGGDGSNPKQVVDTQTFSAMFAPAFAPDGKRLVFGAVGDPTGRGTSFERPHPSGELVTQLARWLGFLPTVAEAHGAPWDVWIVNTDGTGLKRLTMLAEDAPVSIWSPDGKQIAFAGERAIYLVDPEGKAVLRVADEYGSAGLSWLRTTD